MANLLSPDSRVMTGINKVVDVIWISFLWCLICLPLVWIFVALSTIAAFGGDPDAYIEVYKTAFGAAPTDNSVVLSLMLEETSYVLLIEMLVRAVFIGPSTAALYYTMVKVIRRERGYATKTFFHGFKINFKTGAPTSLLFVLFGILMVFDFRYVDAVQAESPTFSSVLNVGLIVVCIFVLFILVWIFPLLSRFTISLKQLLKNAMLISVRHFIGSFVIGGGLIVLFWLLYRFSGDLASILIIFPFVLPGGIALAASFIIEPVLKRYTGNHNKAAKAVNEENGEIPDDSTPASLEGTVSSENGEDGDSSAAGDEEENSSVDEWYME